jgi:hypothetical protein
VTNLRRIELNKFRAPRRAELTEIRAVRCLAGFCPARLKKSTFQLRTNCGVAAGQSLPLRKFSQHLVITFWHHLRVDMSHYVPFDFAASALSARRNGTKSKPVGTGRNILGKNYGTVGWRFGPVRVQASA